VPVGTSVSAAAAAPDRRSPGRPRSPRADEAIISATLDLLAEGVGVEALSMEAVAARAGVGKATIYRRWASKEQLIVDAVATIKGDLPVLAGESVRDDLLTLLRSIAVSAGSRAARIVPCLLSEVRRNAELGRCYQRLSEPRRELIREVLRRGIARGELRADLDLDVVVAMLTAPLVQAALTGNPMLDGGDVPVRLVDGLLPGLRATG